MKNILDFFKTNKVLIIGLLMAAVLPVYELVQTGGTSVKSMVVAASIAATGYLARNLRGQWATIAGIVGTLIASWVAQDKAGNGISWAQIVIQGIVLFLTALQGPAKSIGYEKTATIQEAKKEGEQIVATPAPPAP